MHWSLGRAAGALLAGALSLMPIAAAAHDLTPDELRAGLTANGEYVVDAPTRWDWTTPPVTTLHLRDAAALTDRDLMLLVYPDADAALTAAESGAGLVPGYGPSVRIGNVAVVQASRRALSQLDSAALTALCVPPVSGGGAQTVLPASGIAVDADVLARLDTLISL